jgi:putative transposase
MMQSAGPVFDVGRQQERYRASERLVCRVVGQHRSTQRHPAKVVEREEAKLRSRLREIAADHIR